MQSALHTAPNSILTASFPITAGAGEARPEVPAGAAADARFSFSALSLPGPVLLPPGPSTSYCGQMCMSPGRPDLEPRCACLWKVLFRTELTRVSVLFLCDGCLPLAGYMLLKLSLCTYPCSPLSQEMRPGSTGHGPLGHLVSIRARQEIRNISVA